LVSLDLISLEYYQANIIIEIIYKFMQAQAN